MSVSQYSNYNKINFIKPISNLGSASSLTKAGGLASKYGGFLSGASKVLGPAVMGLQVANMLRGAWKAGEQARNQITNLNQQSAQIRNNLTNNAKDLRSDLTEINEETSGDIANLGEEIGERFEGASGMLGQVIKRGRGLSTGAEGQYQAETSSSLGDAAQQGIERLDTQRGNQYSSLIDNFSRDRSNSQQSLLNMASQRKQLESKDNMWENLI